MKDQRVEFEKQIQALHAQLHEAVEEAVEIPDMPETATIATNTTSFSADSLFDADKSVPTASSYNIANTTTTTATTTTATTTTHPNARQPRVATDAKSAACNSCSIM